MGFDPMILLVSFAVAASKPGLLFVAERVYRTTVQVLSGVVVAHDRLRVFVLRHHLHLTVSAPII